MANKFADLFALAEETADLVNARVEPTFAVLPAPAVARQVAAPAPAGRYQTPQHLLNVFDFNDGTGACVRAFTRRCGVCACLSLESTVRLADVAVVRGGSPSAPPPDPLAIASP